MGLIIFYRLIQLSETTFANNSYEVPSILKGLQEYPITECAVGPKHIVFLLEDGKVCRIAYSTDFKNGNQKKSSEPPGHTDKASQSKGNILLYKYCYISKIKNN